MALWIQSPHQDQTPAGIMGVRICDIVGSADGPEYIIPQLLPVVPRDKTQVHPSSERKIRRHTGDYPGPGAFLLKEKHGNVRGGTGPDDQVRKVSAMPWNNRLNQRNNK